MASRVVSIKNAAGSSKVKLVAAAIDFGTTFTGFAYSLKCDPSRILTSKWSGENVRTATAKAPTCVLFSPDEEGRKLVAFGYEAEEEYIKLLEDENAGSEEEDAEDKEAIAVEEEGKATDKEENAGNTEGNGGDEVGKAEDEEGNAGDADTLGTGGDVEKVVDEEENAGYTDTVENGGDVEKAVDEEENAGVTVENGADEFGQALDQAGKAGDRVGETVVVVGKAGKHYFFERFKMKLYMNKKLNRNTKLADINGKEMLALEVFAKVIGHLKERLEKELQLGGVTNIQEDDIFWVLTVPAIWSDSAKQFMKEAAQQAGIPINCLKLVLEPEAGSLYCNDMPLCKTRKLDGSGNVEQLPVGQKYIVADLGGGTADISVHEILENRNLREIYRSDGGPYGGLMVDTEFLCFLVNVFGEGLIRHMTQFHYEKVLELRTMFETKKRNFTYESITTASYIKLQIPLTDLEEGIEELGEEESVEMKVRKAKENNGDEIILRGDKLCMSPKLFESFFQKAAEGIIKLIENIRKNDEVGEINALLMVGGFSESEYLQTIIKRRIPGLRIIVPPEANLSVLKGAVMMAYNPKVITERIARYTYGFSFAVPFEPGKHPEELKILHDGRQFCSSVFKKLITKGNALKDGDHYGAIAAHTCSPENPFERILPIFIDLYRSEETDPQYTADGYGCELVGMMLLLPPITGWPDASIILQQLVVGESEFTVMGLNVLNGSQVEGKLDFLTIQSEEQGKSTEQNLA